MRDRPRTTTVVLLIVAIDALIVASFLAMDGVGALGVAMVLVAGWTAVVASGLWTGRPWAPLAALLTFGAIAIVALVLSIDIVRRMQEISSQAPPRVHLVAPALITIFAGAITVVVSRSIRREDEQGSDALPRSFEADSDHR